MSNDWFRNEKWNAKIENEFFTRLKRSKGRFHKAQYLRIQAVYLEESYPAEALKLLDMVIDEFQEPGELGQTFLQKAHCLIALSRPDEAVEWFQKVLQQEKEQSNILTDGYLDYAMFVVSTERKELYSEIKLALLARESRLTFPSNFYQYHTALAIINWDEGQINNAQIHARKSMEAAAKEHFGFRYHPKVGLVKKTG